MELYVKKILIIKLNFLLFIYILVLNNFIKANDWPMYRYDIQRSGASPHELPAKLQLIWNKKLPPLTPSFEDHFQVNLDHSYEPIVKDKTLFIGSSRNDTVTAYDIDNGVEKWKFFAGGPVRFAPAAWKDVLIFGSDDGYLYCLYAKSGKLKWKFFAAPSRQKSLGHKRLISSWPICGGPVIDEGIVYFSAGIFPFYGVYIYAVNMETGKEIWSNKTSGKKKIVPFGYFVIDKNNLIVPNGRATPATFDLKSGKFKVMFYGYGKNSNITIHKDFLFTNGYIYDLPTSCVMNRHRVGNAPLLKDNMIYSWAGRGKVKIFNLGSAKIIESKARKGRINKSISFSSKMEVYNRQFDFSRNRKLRDSKPVHHKDS